MKNDEVIGQFLYGIEAENKTLNSIKVKENDARGEVTLLRSYSTLIGTRVYDPFSGLESVTIHKPKIKSSTTSKHINLLDVWAKRWIYANKATRREVISQDV